MSTVADLITFLNRLAPSHLAADWDNVGLLLGDLAAGVERIMTCLTVTPSTVQEAIDAGAQLIVSHHPILFRAAQRITSASPEGRLLWALAKAGVAVHSPHTAFDNTAGGINDLLATKLGLHAVRPLRAQPAGRQCKVVVFVPDADLTKVSDALFAAGAGNIGQYSQCSFRLAGTGTFFGSDAANPVVGQKGRREEVSEWRLEAVCPEPAVERVVAALRAAHSYEEPAYDVYALRPEATSGQGRIGTLPQPIALTDFARSVRERLSANVVQIVGESRRLVQKVAIVCGSGGDFVGDAVGQQADVLLTGEARFHDCLAAEAQNLALVLPGHYASERCGIEDLAARIAKEFPNLHVWPSKNERDPMQVV